MAGREIYLDYAASTPVAGPVVEAMCTHLRGGFANPASDHGPGRREAVAVEAARGRVAALIGADPDEIVWTSGATEANNLALAGAVRFLRDRGRVAHVAVPRTEHRSVLATCEALEREGTRVTYLPVLPDGRLDPDGVAGAIRQGATLVSVAQVNNETGVVQDLAAIAERVREAGGLLHVDAVQGTGRLPLDVRDLPVDLVSLSAHKLYGPKGVGALYVRRRPRRVRLRPLLQGGGQEGGLRSGTLPVHQVVGMGAAFVLAAGRRVEDLDHLGGLYHRLRRGLGSLGGVVLNGRGDGCPHILNVGFLGVHGEALAAELEGLAVSAGSACGSARRSPSHVLRAMGRPDALAAASVRFSLGRQTTAQEVDDAVRRVGEALRRLRSFSPVWRAYDAGESANALYATETPLPLA